MGYNEKNQTVHCFACGATYDIFDLVGQEENLTDFPSKMKAVNRRYGGGEVIRVTAKPTRVFPYKERVGRPDPYFTGRGLSDETVRRFGLLNRATRTAAGRCSCGTVRLWNVRQGKHCL